MLIDHKALLNRLLAGDDIEPHVMEAFVGLVMDGALADVVVSAVLAALRAKGESGPEVAAAARAMRARAVAVPVKNPEKSVDTCGTGGDGAEARQPLGLLALWIGRRARSRGCVSRGDARSHGDSA